MHSGVKASSSEAGLVLYLKLVLTAVFWGGTFVAGRVVAREMEPFAAAFLRFVVASILLFLFLARSHSGIPLPARRQIPFLLLLGLTGIFAYNALFFSGLKSVTAGRASLIIASNPAFILLSSWIFFRERLGLARLVGVALSLAGAAVVISKGSPGEILGGRLGWGELCIFGCVVSWVAYSLIGKTVLEQLSPLVAVTYACAIGAACLLLPALAEGMVLHLTEYSAVAWLGVFYLGFFGSALGFSWYYEGIQAIGPSRAGIFINIVPISAVVLAYFLLHETLDLSLIAGAVLVLTGVYMTNRSP